MAATSTTSISSQHDERSHNDMLNRINGDSSTATVADDAKDIFIFQCASCRSFLTDSTAWVCSDAALHVVAFHSLTENVEMQGKLITSKETIDLGSTYLTLTCKLCHEQIGKLYKTTSRALDSLRDWYSLYVDKITSHQVGSFEVSQLDDRSAMDMLHSQSDHDLRIEIRKMQTLIIGLNEHVKNIENAMELQSDDQDVRKSDMTMTLDSPSARVESADQNDRLSRRKNVMGTRHEADISDDSAIGRSSKLSISNEIQSEVLSSVSDDNLTETSKDLYVYYSSESEERERHQRPTKKRRTQTISRKEDQVPKKKNMYTKKY